MALAGQGADLTVEAVSATGTVIATCPPDGVIIDGVGYACSRATGAVAPVTTIPGADVR